MVFKKITLSKLIVLTIALSFVGCSSEKTSEEDPSKPNILLIVADDLGFTDIGEFGGEIKTPNLDALAKVGVKNTSFYVSPVCSVTRAMLLSGVDNHKNGYGTMEGNWAENQKDKRGYEGFLNWDVVTFPELLKDNGYHTSLSGKWHQAYPAMNKELWPSNRGFDRSFGIIQGGAGHFEDMQRMLPFYKESIYAEDGKKLEFLPKGFYSTDFYADKAIFYIDEGIVQNKPFFCYVAFTAPHWPLQVPDEYLDLYKGQYDDGYEVLALKRFNRLKKLGIINESATFPPLTKNVKPWDELSEEEQKISSKTMEIYAAMVERLDANIGKLISHLKTNGIYDNTLIIFMSDNGAEGNNIGTLGNTGEWVKENFDNTFENMGRLNSFLYTGPAWAQVSTTPFSWYKGFATEGGVRAPSIISYPKWKTKAGKTNDQFISLMDIAPTILELAGIKHPETQYKGREIFPMDGISLVDWFEGEREFTHDPNVAHCWELYGRAGVRKGDWKAEFLEDPYGSNDWRLFNLEDDPAALNNLAADFPEKLEELLGDWTNYVEENNIIMPNEKTAYGKEVYWRD